MVEFALVLPLLLVIIFIIISTALIYSVRIAQQKNAYDAARHVAKFHQGFTTKDGVTTSNGDGTGPLSSAPGGDLDAAVDTMYSLDNPDPTPSHPNKQNNWVLDVFSERVECQKSGRAEEIIGGPNNSVAVSLGPADSHIAVPVDSMAIEVRVCYRPANIPGFSLLTSVYGAQYGVLEEKGIAVRVMDRYSGNQAQDPPQP